MRRNRAIRERNCFRYLLTLRGNQNDLQVSGKRWVGQPVPECCEHVVPLLRLPRQSLRPVGEGGDGRHRQPMAPSVADGQEDGDVSLNAQSSSAVASTNFSVLPRTTRSIRRPPRSTLTASV